MRLVLELKFIWRCRKRV